MNLTLSEDNPTNALYISDSGQALYKVETPRDLTLKMRTTVISRVLPNEDEEIHCQDRWEEIAKIHWHALSESILVFRGQEMKMSEWLKSDVLKRHRTFVGPDGRDYRWTCGLATSSLGAIQQDGKEERVAQMHRRRVPLLRQPRPLNIEIFEKDIASEMLDTLVVSFVCVERRRRMRERALHYWSVSF